MKFIISKIFIILIPIIIILLSSCEKIILGTEEVNNPINNFELFWNDFDRHSGIIYPKSINWDSVYTSNKPKVTLQTTHDELWGIFSGMVDAFDDEHTTIYQNDNDIQHTSGAYRIDDAIQSFSKALIQSKYITDFGTFQNFDYGKIKDKNIGYIHLGGMGGDDPEKNINDILSKMQDVKAIIFDVRNNGGGVGEFSEAVASAFSEGENLAYITQTRNGPNYTDYDNKTNFLTKYDGVDQFLEPVIVLTDAFTVSAAESFTTLLKVNSHVFHIGDTTAGAFSSTSNRRFLPNGWSYQYPIQTSLSPDGISLDGDGIVPDIHIKNEPSDVTNETDVVIEKAIQYLFDTFGIE